ncbi:hypothetical protein [Singulisphaera sp. PoT]|uniref:hypothetical protein n=1 Tax=Singulisphaera sp. PoT TaxID=3411797 RepID=UPI003BF60981
MKPERAKDSIPGTHLEHIGKAEAEKLGAAEGMGRAILVGQYLAAGYEASASDTTAPSPASAALSDISPSATAWGCTHRR